MTAPSIDYRTAQKALGGVKSGANGLLCAGPSHDKRDASLYVTFGDKYPEGFVVHSFSGDDWQECRDYVREKLGLPAWKPNGIRTQEQPVFPAREYIYEDASGEPYHRVDALSDGSFRHYHYDIDGWANGAPAMVIPFALTDTQSDETIWIVRGEANAELVRDGFRQVATTYPSGLDVHADASFLHHLQGKDVRILDVGGARSREFCEAFAKALNAPIYRLPGDHKTLRDFARAENASLDDVTTEALAPAANRQFKLSKLPRLDPEKIQPREWILNHHLIRKFVSLTVSPGGLGKSSMTLVEGLSMAANRPLFDGMRIHEKRKMRVVMWNGEDPQDENMRRLYAAMKHYGVKYEEIEDTMIVESGREKQIKFAQMLRGEVEIQEEFFIELEDELIQNQTDVFTVDPFIQTHGVSENDNGAIDLIIKRLGRLADRVKCAVEIVHHVRKPSSGNKAEPSIDDARGASALKDGIRSGRFLAKMPSELIAGSGLSKDEAEVAFAVTGGKGNMAPVTGKSQWFRMISVPLYNTDEYGRTDDVGVCVSFAMPETEDGFPEDAAIQAQRIAEAKQTYRHWTSGSAPADWFGFAVAREFGMHEIDDKTSIRRMIATWLKSGVLRIAEGYDGNRNTVKYIASSRTSEATVPDDNDEQVPF